ncbi:MBL fold metallo-hydrolase [Gemmatimonas sp.]|jgi:ribonuclease BN (tRNA processing enzyme)|uniref:MBL fold metallo-hydrolase n=1 Tax=Gemmatimonas sp. TaxID=1962908 RepID=UPI0037C0070E
MKLTTIGTGTAAPHASRVAAAHLVEAGDVRLLLDCGSGAVHRMANLGVEWRHITHVALTHFHADHIADLPLLIMGWRWGQLPARTAPVTIYGPVGTGALLERMAAVYGAWLLAPGFPLTVRDIGPDDIVRLPGHVTLQPCAVPHSAESMAYSVSDGARRLVYTGDTGVSEALGLWAQDCDLLLAECSLPDTMAIREHLTPRQAGALAAQARARRLVLTHFYPPVEAIDILAEVAAQYAGPVVCATDGWSVDF